jgi:aldehyde dehydrogenase (NAD+)/retinal dehydrogenase
MANDTEYGLMAGVFTKDITRALRVSARIDAGVVGVNCVSYVSDRTVILNCPTHSLLTLNQPDEYAGSIWWKESFWYRTRVW